MTVKDSPRSRAAAARWAKKTPEEQAAFVERAAEGARRRGTDTHINAIVARAGKLTPAQVETLRSILPPPGQDQAAKRAS